MADLERKCCLTAVYCRSIALDYKQLVQWGKWLELAVAVVAEAAAELVHVDTPAID